ncbi:hypothetical protein PR202_ga03156 [Eleusine coracana subsp. coracana]|uniref:Protein kinase domain-containing protein n=1 Tax=Eleusine coracana subsp. coracana TaxID=191504 RepID=A0AAV5BP75_ELECO|nr:hypothetical protein PR202_ga03156 [Eleusine coracana subsp. coracana]
MAGSGEKTAGSGGVEKRKYPIGWEDYELYEEVGQGASAVVYRALCKPLDEIVAVKVLDFERTNSDLNNIMREAQTMILIDHPNVVKAHCSFAKDQTLWVVMPYMAGGSCLHIMKSVYPTGFEEAVIATVLRQVLIGLEYLHHHGHIHRDVKAGNILVDSRGGIKLADFGVSACLFDSGDRQRARNTFVGTPCWMAPEVMEQLHGYDFKADIWSFGITALELAHGNAPFSKYPPMKVLLMTLQNAPPGLDLERDKKFSRDKDEDLLAQKKMPDGKKEELSQDEYKRGISSWNFDMDDLKSQASLVTECDDNISCKDSDALSFFDMDSLQEQAPEGLHLSRDFTMKYDIDTENDLMANDKSDVSSPEQSVCLSSCKLQSNIHNRDKCNGVLLHVSGETSPEAVSKAPKSAVPNVEEHDDRAKPPLIQQRGRFKVTPGHVELDKEQILNAMKLLSYSDMASPSIPSMASPYIPSASRSISPSSALSVDRSMLEAAHEREKELVNEVLELQWR